MMGRNCKIFFLDEMGTVHLSKILCQMNCPHINDVANCSDSGNWVDELRQVDFPHINNVINENSFINILKTY